MVAITEIKIGSTHSETWHALHIDTVQYMEAQHQVYQSGLALQQHFSSSLLVSAASGKCVHVGFQAILKVQELVHFAFFEDLSKCYFETRPGCCATV